MTEPETEPHSFDAYCEGWHGDFNAAIARAIALADLVNRIKLRGFWPDIYDAYNASDHSKSAHVRVDVVRQAAPHE